MIKIPSSEEVEEITRQSLSLEFPLYHPNHSVFVKRSQEKSRELCINYDSRRSDYSNRSWRTHLDLTVSNDIFYLVSIAINEEFRGQGNGWGLYQAAFSVAREMGFQFVRQTPSGGPIVNGVRTCSRKEYLLKKGCVPAPGIQVDWIIN